MPSITPGKSLNELISEASAQGTKAANAITNPNINSRPIIPPALPSPLLDLFAKGLEIARASINKRPKRRFPSNEELEAKHKQLLLGLGEVDPKHRTQQSKEFDTRTNKKSSFTAYGNYNEQYELGEEPAVRIEETVTGQEYKSPADRIDRDIYLINVDTGEKKKLPFVPKELKYEPTSNWKTINSMGRNTPLYHYTGGEDVLEFEIDWFTEVEGREDVINNCKWVEALSKADGYAKSPPLVHLHWNTELFSKSYWIVTAAPYRLLDFQAHRNMLPQQAYQQITLKRVTGSNLLHKDYLSITV
jgi:hypothetical protein